MRSVCLVEDGNNVLGPMPLEEALETSRTSMSSRGIIVDSDMVVYAIRGPGVTGREIQDLDLRNAAIRHRLNVNALT
jgi:hypothetical protein